MSVKRYLGTFYRGRRLYIPLLLLMLLATALVTYFVTRSQYEATARIWVDRPVLDTLLDPNSTSNLNVTSPAQEQSDKLTQLIQTDSFLVAVLKDTTASGRLISDEDRTIKDVRGKLSVTPLGSNTVKVTYDDSNPLLCEQVVQNTIDQFRTWDITSRVQQSSVEQEFYQKQLQIYQDQEDAAAKRLSDFQAAHPSPDPTSPQYLELQGLQRDLESARALVNATSAKIQQADAADSLSDSSQYEFQVLDLPTVPKQPTATLTHLAEYLALGIAASLLIIFGAVAFATWQDTTVRNRDDLQRLTGAPLLSSVPHLPLHHPAADSGGGKRARAVQQPEVTRQIATGQFEEPATAYPTQVVE